ncbi:transcriptional regulator [Burkholderia sp. Ch1-1]|nr:transcriptional regulator [Burkholderia sp. Ch1-1]
MAISSAQSKPLTTAKSRSSEGVVAQSEKARLVLAGARKVFFSHGYSVATTDMIQQAAGVSKSTVYAHYPNKEALFVAVVEAECEHFLSTIRKLKFTSERLADILTAMARAYLEIVLSREGLALFRMVASEAPRFPELGRGFYIAGPGTVNHMVAEKLEAAVSRGEVDLGGIGIDCAAAMFVNLVRGELMMQCLMHPDAPASAAQRDQWTKDAVRVFLRALQKTK